MRAASGAALSDAATGQLLLARWLLGSGPPERSGSCCRYLAVAPAQGGVLLVWPPDPAEPLPEAGQVALYSHWQGSLPGRGFLDGAAPISMFAADVAAGVVAGWDAYYRDEHFPAVLGLDGYAAGARFRLHRRLREGEGRAPEWLTLYQLEGHEALTRLGQLTTADPDATEVYADWQRRGAPLTSNVVMARFVPDPQ